MLNTLATLSPIIVQDYNGQIDEQGCFAGESEATFFSGNTYSGSFANGQMEGHGVYTWAKDGTTFSGDFFRNRITGRGEYVWHDAIKLLIHPQELRDKIFGKRVECNAPWGEWQKGQPNGVVFLGANYLGYEGDWEDGMKHGHGTMTYPSGNVYTGEWRYNLKHGAGEMIWKDRGESYDGEWSHGRPNGYGVHIWRVKAVKYHQFPMFNLYRGGFKEGKRHGEGTFFYASGARYNGEWLNGKKHGQGTYIAENGQFYSGEFHSDKMCASFDRFQNDSPFIFSLNGLISMDNWSKKCSVPTASTSEQLKQINNVFLCYTDDLHEIYSFYCRRRQRLHPQSVFLSSTPGVITRLEIWHFMKNCTRQVIDCETRVQVDRAYADLFRNAPHHIERFMDPHKIDETFIFFDFLQIILCIAILRFKRLGDPKMIEDSSPASVLALFMKTGFTIEMLKSPDLEVIDSSRLPDSSALRNQAEHELYEEFHKMHIQRMFSLYLQYGSRSDVSLVDSSGDITMSLRHVLHLLDDLKLLGPGPHQMEISEIIDFLASIRSEEFDEAESELVPLTLFNTIFFFAKKVASPYLSLIGIERSEASTPESRVASAIDSNQDLDIQQTATEGEAAMSSNPDVSDIVIGVEAAEDDEQKKAKASTKVEPKGEVSGLSGEKDVPGGQPSARTDRSEIGASKSRSIGFAAVDSDDKQEEEKATERKSLIGSSGKASSVSGLSGFQTPSTGRNGTAPGEERTVSFEPSDLNMDPFEASREVMSLVFEYILKERK